MDRQLEEYHIRPIAHSLFKERPSRSGLALAVEQATGGDYYLHVLREAMVTTHFGLWPFDAPLLILDVETTGANVRFHQVVALGAVLVNGATLEETRSMCTLVRATRAALEQADPRAMAIHGLTSDRLVNAPSPPEVVSQFLNTFGTNFYFCGWNICFDTHFLAALFQEAGRYQDYSTFRYHKLDLWTLLEFAWVRGLIPTPPESLSVVSKMFGIQRAELHDPLEDARISAEVLRKTLSLFEGVGK